MYSLTARILKSLKAMIETTFTTARLHTAAAITANLAKGASVKEAVHNAKDFITAAIEKGFRLNQYVGPVWHGAHREKI